MFPLASLAKEITLTLIILIGWFLLQSIVIYTAGIKLFMHLSIEKNLSVEAARVVCLFVCAIIVIIGAEVFHRLVDLPSKKLAFTVFDWIRK